MNINDYRRAMDQIVPDTELKERIMERKNGTRSLHARRAFTVALAAALAAVCLCTAALAASPELRTAVLSFFRMEEREQVPGGSQSGSQDGPDISWTEIGQLVKAQYIHLDGYPYRYMGGGLLSDLTWSEDYRTLLEAKFWEVRDNELIPVEISMETTEVDITFKGARYQGLLYWFVRNGELAVFQGSPVAIDTRAEEQWYVNSLPGRTDTVMLRLYEGRQMEYTEYPILYHLDTGEVEDILVDTGADALEYAYDYSWSEDFLRAIILCGSGPDDQQTWVCDRESKTLTRLEDLTGMEAEYAGFLDNDALILTAYGEDEEDTWTDVTCWVYDIPSGRAVKTLDQLPCYRWWDEAPRGATIYGKNCLYVSETGQTEVIDLRTGERIPVEGFTYQKGDDFMISPSGNKLLYFSTNPGIEGLGITQLGVVDLEKRTFIAFDREGYEDLYEESIGWEDDTTVGIGARTLDRETRYMLLYSF